MADAPETEPRQMPYKDALDYAIFCLNTFMHPDASNTRDVIALEVHADEVIATLVDIRETVQGMAVTHVAPASAVADAEATLRAMDDLSAKYAELLRDIIGDHCEAHAEFEPTCSTCQAVEMTTPVTT